MVSLLNEDGMEILIVVGSTELLDSRRVPLLADMAVNVS